MEGVALSQIWETTARPPRYRNCSHGSVSRVHASHRDAATINAAVCTRLPFDKLRAGSETRLQLADNCGTVLRAVARNGRNCLVPPAVLAGVGADAGSVSFGGIVVIVAGATAARETIQDQAGRANTSGAHEREGAGDRVAGAFSGPDHHP